MRMCTNKYLCSPCQLTPIREAVIEAAKAQPVRLFPLLALRILCTQKGRFQVPYQSLIIAL